MSKILGKDVKFTNYQLCEFLESKGYVGIEDLQKITNTERIEFITQVTDLTKEKLVEELNKDLMFMVNITNAINDGCKVKNLTPEPTAKATE